MFDEIHKTNFSCSVYTCKTYENCLYKTLDANLYRGAKRGANTFSDEMAVYVLLAFAMLLTVFLFAALN